MKISLTLFSRKSDFIEYFCILRGPVYIRLVISYSHMLFVPFVVSFALLGLHLDGLTLYGSECFSCVSVYITKLVHVNTSHVFLSNV